MVGAEDAVRVDRPRHAGPDTCRPPLNRTPVGRRRLDDRCSTHRSPAAAWSAPPPPPRLRRPASTSSPTGWRRALPAPPEQRCTRRSSTSCRGSGSSASQGVAVVVPPLPASRAGEVRGPRRARRAPRCARGARAGARRPRGRLPAHAGRAVRNGGLGPPLLPALGPRSGEAGDPVRPARLAAAGREVPSRGGRDGVPERPAGNDPRGERRRLPAPQRQPRCARRGRTGCSRGCEAFREDERPRRVRRRRPHPAPEPAEDDGDARPHPGRRADPPKAPSCSSASPRPWRGARPAADRQLRDARLRAGCPTRTSRAAHTCTSRILFEDVNAWYLNFDRTERVHAMFRPGLEIEATRRTVGQDSCRHPDDRSRCSRLRAQAASRAAGSIQSASRLAADVVGPNGTRYPKGTAVPQRADFNTLDNPFAWTVPGARPPAQRAAEGGALRRLQPDGRRLPPRAPGDGRDPPERRLASLRAALDRPGDQLVFHTTHRRTSSSHPGRTARSRCPSSRPDAGTAGGPVYTGPK